MDRQIALRVSIHGSAEWLSSYGMEAVAEALREAGLYVALVEGPPANAPDSDFWFVFADRIEEYRISDMPADIRRRLILLQPDRGHAFRMLEEAGAAGAVTALAQEWRQPISGNFAGRRDIVSSLGGRLRKGIVLFGESENYSVWENSEIPTLAEHVARYLEAFGSRSRI